MPKFTYSASRGIEQSNGSGFVINDVSITEGSETIASGEINAYGVNVLTAGQAFTLSSDGDTAGQKVTCIFNDTDTLTVTSGDDITATAAGEVAVLLWNGSAWIRVSA